jgi:hypothetical protein
MCQKDATCENTERAQGAEKLTATANDAKHRRQSRKSQKGENEHKRSNNFECNAESKATEQPTPTMETAEQEQRRAKEGKLQPEESKKHLIGTCLWFSNRKSFRKREIKRCVRRAEVTSTNFIDFASSVRKSFAFLRSTLSTFIPSVLLRSVFLIFCSCFPFRSFLTSCVAPSFPLYSNQSTRKQ